MYLVSLRVLSNCGLASASEKSNKIIYSLAAYPVDKNLNSVFALTFINDKGDKYNIQYIMKELRKDFLGVHIISNKSNNIIAFFGVKRGHGVLYPIYNNAIPILPNIASNKYEIFNFIAYDKLQITKITEDISKYNIIDYIHYERINNIALLMDLLMRRIKDLVMYDLNDNEKRILSLAYDQGYFSWPKGIDISKLAQETKYSKPMVSYYLRHSISKILSKLFT